MRKLTTSLSLLTLLVPASAFAQEAVTLDEVPAEEAPAEEPAAPAPVALDETPAPAPAPEPAPAATASVGLDAAAPAPALASEPAAEPALRRPPSTRGGGPGGGDKWEFSYSGYFRAPMRIGIGSNAGPEHSAEAGRLSGQPALQANPDGLPLVKDADGNWVNGQFHKKRVSLHRPIIPDDQYASWQFTGHNKSDWAEMFFGVGNGMVNGYLAVQGFRFTDANWKEDNAQFGISQGWVEIDHDLGFQNVKFNAKVGSHWNRYGAAGVYDSGEYDTYLFGRTHTMGGTARVDLILPAFDIGFEGGFGVKTPDPKMFNRARFTNLAHGHAFFKVPSIEISAHLLHAWASDSASPSYPNVQPGSSGCYYNTTPGAQCTVADDGISAADGSERAGGVNGTEGRLSVFGPEYPVGQQTVVGADAKFDLGLLGYLYAGYSYQFLKNSLTVDGAIESIHSLGAGNYNLGIVDNYLESPFCNASAPNESCSNGTGAVGSAMLQYELGLANFGILPGSMDLKTKLYGMLNHVSVDDIEVQRLQALYAGADAATINEMRQNGTIKVKFGADMEFFALDWMSAGLRFDRLNPTNNKLLKGTQGFAILSPRISFRTKMVTHETITLQYSRYFYDQRQCQDSAGNVASPADDPFRAGNATIYGTTSADTMLPLRHYCVQPAPSAPPPNGFGMHSNNQDPGLRGASSLVPDENVVKLEASMWW